METPQVNIQQLMDSFHLDNILKEKLVNVVTMQAPPGAEIDPNVPSEYKLMRIVFTRGFTMGVIIGDTYHVRPDFFKGGSRSNPHIDNETKLIMETYNLKRAVAIDPNPGVTEKLIYLGALVKQSETELDPEKLLPHVKEAEAIANELQSAEAKKMYSIINANYTKLTNIVKDDDIELMGIINEIFEEMQASSDDEEVAQLANKAAGYLSKLQDPTPEMKNISQIVDKTILAARNVGKKNNTEEIIDTNEDEEETGSAEEEKKYQDLIKKGDNAFNSKNFKKAWHFYKDAQKIFPKRTKAKQQIAAIEQEAKKQNLKLE